MPNHLTNRAKRLLQESRDLIGELRQLGEEPMLAGDEQSDDPLGNAYHEVLTMTEAAVRLVQVFPDAPSQQIRLSSGLEGILRTVRERVESIRAALTLRRRDALQVHTLAELLTELNAGKKMEWAKLVELSDALLGEEVDTPLRFLSAAPSGERMIAGESTITAPGVFVACHALTGARVMARLVQAHADGTPHPRDAIVAALIHDVGMMRVPLDALNKPESLDDGEQRAVEAHVRLGVELLMDKLPEASHLLDGIAHHHERLDGTGYPGGLKGEQVHSLGRLLAVVDVYAAMVNPRPYRPALDPRTALTDTLMLAEEGQLDRTFAEMLLRLSFYPVGSVVELADGRVAVVVANPLSRPERMNPARPVLSVLADSAGQLLANPRYVDLSVTESGQIVRAIPAKQRRELLGTRYPEFV